jgi:hypothetical protein
MGLSPTIIGSETKTTCEREKRQTSEEFKGNVESHASIISRFWGRRTPASANIHFSPEGWTPLLLVCLH